MRLTMRWKWERGGVYLKGIKKRGKGLGGKWRRDIGRRGTIRRQKTEKHVKGETSTGRVERKRKREEERIREIRREGNGR